MADCSFMRELLVKSLKDSQNEEHIKHRISCKIFYRKDCQSSNFFKKEITFNAFSQKEQKLNLQFESINFTPENIFPKVSDNIFKSEQRISKIIIDTKRKKSRTMKSSKTVHKRNKKQSQCIQDFSENDLAFEAISQPNLVIESRGISSNLFGSFRKVFSPIDKSLKDFKPHNSSKILNPNSFQTNKEGNLNLIMFPFEKQQSQGGLDFSTGNWSLRVNEKKRELHIKQYAGKRFGQSNRNKSPNDDTRRNSDQNQGIENRKNFLNIQKRNTAQDNLVHEKTGKSETNTRPSRQSIHQVTRNKNSVEWGSSYQQTENKSREENQNNGKDFKTVCGYNEIFSDNQTKTTPTPRTKRRNRNKNYMKRKRKSGKESFVVKKDFKNSAFSRKQKFQTTGKNSFKDSQKTFKDSQKTPRRDYHYNIENENKKRSKKKKRILSDNTQMKKEREVKTGHDEDYTQQNMQFFNWKNTNY